MVGHGGGGGEVDELLPHLLHDIVERGRFEEATAALEAVVARAPRSEEAWYHLCFARLRCGRGEAALTAAEHLLEVCPDEAAGPPGTPRHGRPCTRRWRAATAGRWTPRPFPKRAFNDANSKVQITYSAVTDLTVAALRVPRAV